jgi:AcrR family transcriptional regulator
MSTTTAPEGVHLRADAERNRLRILAAARRVFSARGLDVTLDDIAREAGVGVATVYRRFNDREDLIDHVFQQALVEVADVAESALAEPDPWLGFVALIEGSAELFDADRGLRDVFLNAQRGQREVAMIRERLSPRLEAVLRRAQDDGSIRLDLGPTDVALMLMTLGAVSDHARDHFPDLWRRYLALLLEGVRRREDQALLPGKALTPAEFDVLLSQPS